MLFNCQDKTKDKDQTGAHPNKSFKTAPVEIRSLQLPILANGQLELQQESFLSFKVGGNIAQLSARKGDQVRQGQLLASLRPEDFQERVVQAEATLKRRKKDLARTEKLFEENIGTLQNLEELRTAVDIAESNFNIAQSGLKDAYLYAPNSGIILDRFREKGEVASPGTPVFKISGQGASFVFKASLTDEQVVKIKMGDSCQITFSAYEGQAHFGRVSHIETSPDPATGLYLVDINFAKKSLALKPGFIGKVEIYPPQQEKFAFIPPEALIEANKYEGKVYIKGENQQLISRKVQIAYILDQEIAIRKGLEGIQNVIIP
ncbi:MAG: efflux RND transporter periplasmic adaptor subunit [Bacteroidota bacterium]